MNERGEIDSYSEFERESSCAIKEKNVEQTIHGFDSEEDLEFESSDR